MQIGNLLVPIGAHLFTPDALQKALTDTLPQLPPGKTLAVAGGIDASGAKVAVIFQSLDSHWTAKAAFAHEWTGDTKVGGTVTFSK